MYAFYEIKKSVYKSTTYANTVILNTIILIECANFLLICRIYKIRLAL